MTIKFGLVTVSDTCSAGKNIDTASGKLLEAILQKFPGSNYNRIIVPDEKDDIIRILENWTSTCNVIFTIGGTGFSPRDITPEATRSVIQREAPGLSYAMISRSLAITETSMLSRAVCGIRDHCLIVNLPGSAKAAVECFGFIKDVLPHAIEVLTNATEKISKDHMVIQQTENAGGDDCKEKEVVSESKVKLNNVASRTRDSPYKMLKVQDACAIIQRNIHCINDVEFIPFEESLNRVLAEDVIAKELHPPFRASIKNGYAVRSIDDVIPRTVVDSATAGYRLSNVCLEEGEAVRISTGGPVPEGADAVVQIEDTEILEKSPDNSKEIKIHIKVAPNVGQDIRDIGSDISQGEVVLHSKTIISPACVGVLAMLGKTDIMVYRTPMIAILSTGNEIRNPRDKLEPGQIRDSNKYSLMNMLRRYGYNPIDFGSAKDNPNSVKNILEKAFIMNDIVITSGGISMGEYDIIKQVLIEDFEATIHFARVNMKPGEPTTFATIMYKGKKKMFFGLPGNPVSCSVTCILFVIPTLRCMTHLGFKSFPFLRTTGGNIPGNIDNRLEYHSVSVNFQNGAARHSSTGNQISSRLNSMVEANGLSFPFYNNHDKTIAYTLLFDIY